VKTRERERVDENQLMEGAKEGTAPQAIWQTHSLNFIHMELTVTQLPTITLSAKFPTLAHTHTHTHTLFIWRCC